MNPLRLSPLPVLRAEDEAGSLLMEREGFVDEAMVAAMVFGPTSTSRQVPHPQDLALAADDLDFAGWKLSSHPPARMVETKSHSEVPRRRPAPPVIEEPGLGVPHSGSHRWWLAGLAGVLSTMLFSILLLHLSSRPGTRLEAFFVPRPPAVSAPLATPKVDSPRLAAELTKVSTDRP